MSSRTFQAVGTKNFINHHRKIALITMKIKPSRKGQQLRLVTGMLCWWIPSTMVVVNDRIRSYNRFICGGVDISIYVLQGRVDSIPRCLSFCNCTVPGVSLCRSISNLTGRCVRCVWLCSVVRSFATQDDVNKGYVCTLTTSPGINRPPHLRPSRARPDL